MIKKNQNFQRRFRCNNQSGLIENLGIVTVAWRDVINTCGCIWSVLNSSVRPTIMVIVDNGSGDGTFQGIKNFLEGHAVEVFDPFAKKKKVVSVQDVEDRFSFKLEAESSDWTMTLTDSPEDGKTKIILLSMSENLGFSAGNNAGVAALLALGFNGAIWLLNNDAFIAPDCLDALCRRSLRAELPPVFGTVLVEFSDCAQVQAAGGTMTKLFASPRNLMAGEKLLHCHNRMADATVKADYPIGASFFTWTDLFHDSSKAFFEGYFLYYEEADHAAQVGVDECDIYLDARVAHLGGASTGSDLVNSKSSRSALRDYYSARARVIFVRRNRIFTLGPVVFFLTIQSIKRILACDYKASIALMRGLRSGYKYIF